MPREKSAGAVIFRRADNETYYLLLHYEAGHWDFPKGNIEEGEKEEDTVRREVKEETGIEDIKIIKGFKEWIKYFYRKEPSSFQKGTRFLKVFLKENEWVFKIVVYYLAETKTPHQNKHGARQAKEVKISFEHLGYKWLPYKQALERITYKNAKEILKKANKFLQENASIS